MKILIIQLNYPPDHSGAGIDIKRTYEFLYKSNNSLNFVVLAEKNSKYIKEVRNGITIKRILYKWNPKKVFKMISSSIIVLKEIISSDIIHFNALYPIGLLFIPVANYFGKKTLLQIHAMGADDPASVKKRKNGRLLYYFYLKAKYFKTYSKAQTTELINNGIDSNRIFEVPPFVNSKKYIPQNKQLKTKIRKKLDISDDSIVITTIGRIGIRKGTDIILDIFDIMKRKYSNIIFLLVGPTQITEFKTLKISEDLAKRTENINKLDQRIRLLGEINNVDEILQASDFFVLPSRDEGFGIVLIEAMACGLPTIVSNLQGIFDTIISNEYDGYIVNEYIAKDYVNRIDKLIKDKKLYNYISSNAIHTVKSRFVPHVTLKNIGLFFVDNN